MQEQPLVEKLFCGLMALDTVNPPGNEQCGATYLYDILSAAGFRCELQDLGNNRANLIAEFGCGRPVVEFCGHLDVVPFAGCWQHTPLAATLDGDRYYGRGACDMKGGIAAMCAAAIALQREGGISNGTLRLTFVADEEHANLGMHAYLRTHTVPDFTVIGEPTELNVAIAHRGVARFYVDLHGASRHAALPASQASAVSEAARAILAVEQMNRTLGAQRHEVLPPPSIVVTQLSGYEKDNVVPAAVRLLVDFRLLPGTDEAQARAQLETALHDGGVTHFTLEKRFYMPGGALSANDAFVTQCAQTLEHVLARRIEPCAFDASCEQCFLLAAGTKAVICGPGSLAQAHTTDEWVAREQLIKAVTCYQELAKVLLEGTEDEQGI